MRREVRGRDLVVTPLPGGSTSAGGAGLQPAGSAAPCEQTGRGRQCKEMGASDLSIIKASWRDPEVFP